MIKLSIGYKLMISYMLLVIVPIGCIGYYSYSSSVNAVRNETESTISSTLQQTITNMRYRLNDVERAGGQLYYDQQFQNALFDFSGGWEGYQSVTQEIEPRLNVAASLASFNITLSIYLTDANFPERYTIYNGNPIDTGTNYAIYHLARIATTSWYKAYTQQGVAYGVWAQVDNDAVYNNISYLMTITDFQNGSMLGLIRVTASLQDLFDAVNQLNLGASSFAVIADKEQKIKKITNYTLARSSLRDLPKDYLVVKDAIQDLQWTLVVYVPPTKFQQAADQIRNIMLLLCSLLFLFLSGVGWYISRQFSKRVTRITTAFREFQVGEFHKRLSNQGMDELAQIEQAFNEMASNVERLVHEVYVIKLQKKEAELNILQAQINPHFLYNTLSAIGRLGQFGQVEKLQEMVVCLAKFYRLSLNKGKMFIAVADELQQIRAYLDIQQIRYGAELVIQYDIDAAVLEYIMMKLLLQPFVENILEHARSTGTLHIDIRAYKEQENLIFEVKDDGVGIEEETLARFQSTDAEQQQFGYGIYNVNRRIKLHYGENYGVSILSQRGLGTTVKICIPALSRAQGQERSLISGPLELSTT